MLGNLLAKTEGATSHSLTYDLTTRAKHAPKSVDGVAQSYDANSNLTADNQHNYGYDAENRLISVATGTIPGQGATLIQYVYDAGGQRRKKVDSATGHTTIYVGASYEKDTATG